MADDTDQKTQLLGLVPPAVATVPAPIPAQVSYTAPMNPYAALYGGRESLLSTESEQQKALDAYHKFLQSASGPTPAEKAHDIVNSVFGDIVAPAMAAFGGRRASSGGLQLIQQAKQDLQNSKNDQRVRQQQALGNAKAMVDIMNITSPYSQKNLATAAKAASEQAKVTIAGQDSATKRMNAFNREKHLQNADAELTRRNNETANWHGIQQQLANKNIQLGYDKLDQTAKLENAKNQLSAAIAEKHDEIMKQGLTLQRQKDMQDLYAKYKMYNATQGRLVQQFNTEAALKASKVDPKTGQFVFQGKDGKPLEVSPLSVPDNQLETDLTNSFSDPRAEAINQGDQIVAQQVTAPTNPNAQPTASQPTTAAAQPVPPNVAGAISKFFSLIPGRSAQQVQQLRQKFMLQSGGIDPFQFASASNGNQ